MVDEKFITWKIEEQITQRLDKFQNVNGRILYVADVHCEIMYISELKKKESVRKKQILILPSQLYDGKPGKSNLEYFIKDILRKCKISEKQQMEIKKVVLKKELSCCMYNYE